MKFYLATTVAAFIFVSHQAFADTDTYTCNVEGLRSIPNFPPVSRFYTGAGATQNKAAQDALQQCYRDMNDRCLLSGCFKESSKD